MRRSRRGQSMVEFALVFPILLMLILGIIDVSYLIFNWAEVQFAARRGAEQAAKLPPETVQAPVSSNYYSAAPPFNQGYSRGSDSCYNMILNETQRIGMFSSASTIEDNEVHIAWYVRGSGTNPDSAFTLSSASTARKKLNIIEIFIRHDVAPLTPLGDAVLGDTLTFTSASRRTIVNEASSITTC